MLSISYIKFINKLKDLVSYIIYIYVSNNSEADEVKLIGLIYQRSER